MFPHTTMRFANSKMNASASHELFVKYKYIALFAVEKDILSPHMVYTHTLISVSHKDNIFVLTVGLTLPELCQCRN